MSNLATVTAKLPHDFVIDAETHVDADRICHVKVTVWHCGATRHYATYSTRDILTADDRVDFRNGVINHVAAQYCSYPETVL